MKMKKVLVKNAVEVRRHLNIDAEFVCFEAATSYRYQASVIDRGTEMVIDISGDGFTEYLIVGKAKGNCFEGSNSARGDVSDVHATWTKVANKYVGIWIENGYEWIFVFELPGH